MTPNNKFLLKILASGIFLLLAYKLLPLIEGSLNGVNTNMILQALFLIILLYFFIKMGASRASSTNYSSILLWVLIFAILIIAYAFRFELDSFKHKILAVVIPSYSWTDKQGELVIARSQDGHFYVNAKTQSNNTIKFLIDTGASDIALTKEAAIALGIDLSKLNYTTRSSTANGIAYSAPVKIKQLTIGKKTFYNLSANVSSGGLDISLLGMSLIDDFKNFKITNDMLILSY
jgi:aspartyl protease family protein